MAQQFDGVEVGFACVQQTHIGLDQAAGMDAALAGNQKAWLDDLVNLGEAFEVLPDQAQSRMRRQVVGQAFDLEVGWSWRWRGIQGHDYLKPRADFTRWVRGYLLATRARYGMGLAGKWSRIQVNVRLSQFQ